MAEAHDDRHAEVGSSCSARRSPSAPRRAGEKTPRWPRLPAPLHGPRHGRDGDGADFEEADAEPGQGLERRRPAVEDGAQADGRGERQPQVGAGRRLSARMWPRKSMRAGPKGSRASRPMRPRARSRAAWPAGETTEGATRCDRTSRASVVTCSCGGKFPNLPIQIGKLGNLPPRRPHFHCSPIQSNNAGASRAPRRTKRAMSPPASGQVSCP